MAPAAESWQPTLESIGRHTAPDWLLDAKLGIQFVGEPHDFSDNEYFDWQRSEQRMRELGADRSDADFIFLDDCHLTPSAYRRSTLRLLGAAAPLAWTQQGADLVVQLPAQPPGQHAFSLAIATE